MSKPREAASRALLAAAKRAQSLALDLRAALLAFEGEPRAQTLILQCRRLASDVEEYAVDLGRRPAGAELPIIAAIEARARPPGPIREPVIPADDPPGINPDPVAGDDRAEDLDDSPAFVCNRCNHSRPPHAGHPCPECKCPEFRLVNITPGELTDYEKKLAIVDDAPAERRGPGRPPVAEGAGPVPWRVWDDVRSVELEPVTSATLEGAKKKAKRAHPGLRKVRVEPIAVAP